MDARLARRFAFVELPPDSRTRIGERDKAPKFSVESGAPLQ
jgi:hypothetical protein